MAFSLPVRLNAAGEADRYWQRAAGGDSLCHLSNSVSLFREGDNKLGQQSTNSSTEPTHAAR